MSDAVAQGSTNAVKTWLSAGCPAPCEIRWHRECHKCSENHGSPQGVQRRVKLDGTGSGTNAVKTMALRRVSSTV